MNRNDIKQFKEKYRKIAKNCEERILSLKAHKEKEGISEMEKELLKRRIEILNCTRDDAQCVAECLQEILKRDDWNEQNGGREHGSA